LVSKSCTAAGNSLIGFPFKLIACAGIISKNIDGSKGQEKPSSKKVLKEQNKNNDFKKPPSDYDPYFTETQTITKPFGPIGITRNMVQDKKGNYWLATWEGIMKYDRNVFTNYTNKDSLRRYHVFAVLEDRSDNLWFGTIGAGVYLYDGTTFTNYTTEDGLSYNGIGCIYEDKNNFIWLGTQNGLNRYDGKKFQKFIIDGGGNNNDINSIIIFVLENNKVHSKKFCIENF